LGGNSMGSVVVEGWALAAVGVPTDRVVEAFDELEHRPGQLPSIDPVLPVQQLGLQGGEEALGQGVEAPIDVKPPSEGLRCFPWSRGCGRCRERGSA
jgi:hypothetical protein